MTIRQFIKIKDKFAGDDYKAYEIATLDLNDFFVLKKYHHLILLSNSISINYQTRMKDNYLISLPIQ